MSLSADEAIESDEKGLVDDRNDIYLSVYSRYDKCRSFGVAYLDKFTETIYIGKFGEQQQLNNFKLQLNPRVIITQTSEHNGLHQLLKKSHHSRPYKMKIMKRNAFNYEHCKSVLTQISFNDNSDSNNNDNNNNNNNQPYEHSTNENKLLALYSIINFDDVVVISSLGALCQYIMKHRILDQLEDDLYQKLMINDIKEIPFNTFNFNTEECYNLMYIDASTMNALSVFKSEKTPSSKGSTTMKEGYSLYKIIEINCKISCGSKKLREWLTFPISNANKLWYRLDHIEWLINNDTNGIFEQIEDLLPHIGDLRANSLRIVSFKSKYNDWCQLYNSLKAINSLCQLSRINTYDNNTSVHSNTSNSTMQMDKVPIFRRLLESYTDGIDELKQILSAHIDFPQTKVNKKLTFKHGVNENLDALNLMLENIPAQQQQITLNCKQNGVIPNNNDIEFVFKPFMGFFLSVPSSSNYCTLLAQNGTLHQFEASNYKYFRSNECLLMNQHFGNVETKINTIENDIIVELEKLVLQKVSELEALSESVAEIDCLCALAATALQRNWCKPQLFDKNAGRDFFEFDDGWHPIQPTFLSENEQFINNDITFGGGERIKILTGPNQSGKSVYLKQCGIIAYLVHIGSYVPAQSCRLTVMDKILTRIHCNDDCNSSLSTYTRDCCQMAHLLKNNTSNSLILIDEFGKGTLSRDGIALMTSIINNFNELKENAPKVLIATHFHELFQYDLIKQTNFVKFYFMEIVTQQMIQNDENRNDNQENEENKNENEHKNGNEEDIKISDEDNNNNHNNNNNEGAIRQEITFLYKVKRGICESSFGIECAKSAGISKEVRDRTQVIINCIKNKQVIPPVLDENHDKIIQTANKIHQIIMTDDQWQEGERFTRLIELIKRWP